MVPFHFPPPASHSWKEDAGGGGCPAILELAYNLLLEEIHFTLVHDKAGPEHMCYPGRNNTMVYWQG